MPIIAVDFDGTLCEDKFPDIGEPNIDLINELILFRMSKDNKLILWTCRCDEHLDRAVRWCKGYGLEFDAVNDNIKERKDKYPTESRKVCADYYLDDKFVDIKSFRGSTYANKQSTIRDIDK